MKLPGVVRNGLLIERKEGFKRYTESGYVFDMRIIWGGVLLVLALFVWVVSQVGFGNTLYVNCPVSEPYCENPLYGSACYFDECIPLMHMEYFPGGFVYGEEPPVLFDQFVFFMFGIMVCAFIVNHLVHNFGKGLFEVEP